jgi:hypothetical protein
MKTTMRKVIVFSAGLLIGLDMVGCAKAPNSATPLAIQLQFGAYTTAQQKNPIWKFLEVPKANAAVSSLKMCFKRLRFKAADQDTAAPDTASDNVDFAIGEITVGITGASLGAIAVPAGNYKRIEFDLDSTCASGKSIQLVNGNGSFSSTQRMTIKFRGNFDATTDGTLTLGVQTILDALNAYNSTDLKVAVEAISGDLHN